jgi:hypothetical protein
LQILSHEGSREEASSCGSKVQGHALTIKDEYIPSLLEICSAVSGGSFLACDIERSAFWSVDTSEKVFILEEELLVRSIDTNSIKNWDDFEFALALIIENRLL